MTQQNINDNTVVILSDDDEDEVLNVNGKRERYSEDEEEEDGEEDYDSVDEYEAYMQSTRHRNRILKSQTLPEDHEPVILSEREIENPWNQINTLISNLKRICIPESMTLDDVETSFACGVPVKDNAPDIAINVEGILGPITFPLYPKDAQRILNLKSNNQSCFYLDTSKILLNLSFQEYLFETLLPEITSYLGINQIVANQTLLKANKFYVCEKGKKLNLSPSMTKGTYGTVLLFLPTDFTGGNMNAEFQDQTTTFQPETDILNGCYFVAWYNNVKTEFSPVTSGHQVSIEFSLVYTGTDPLINVNSLQQRRIMIENGELTLEQKSESNILINQAITFFQSIQKEILIYFLNYTYNLPSLSIDGLKQSDKMITKLLTDIVSKTDCSIYLGLIERTVDAKVAEGDEEDCPMDEEGILITQNVIKDTFTLTSLGDEKGHNLLSAPVIIDSNHPMIQGVGWFAKCKPDAEEYIDNEKIVKYWYSKKTALIFIPKSKLDSLVKL